MSFLTGTNCETIYASTVAGAAKASFTTEVAINDTATMGVQAHLPPDFWLPQNYGSVGKGIRIVARGIVSSTATPTFQWSVRAGAAASTTAAILLGTAALTTNSGISNVPWELEGDVILKTMGAAGANSTVTAVGRLLCTGFSTATAPYYAAWGGGATPGTATTLDTSITNYINFNIVCGTNNASNSIQLQQLLVFGLN